MTVISTFRNISAFILVAIVARGTLTIDTRFTVLLMPPFVYWYSLNNLGFVEELPVVRYMSRPHANLVGTVGVWPARLLMAIAGCMIGFYVANLGNAEAKGA